MTLVYTTCHRMPWLICIIVRFIMTLHLGYYNYIWAKRLCCALYFQLKELCQFVWVAMRFMPAFFFETMRVLFDVFIGWPLLGSICSILFIIYIVPIAFPEMGLSSVFIDIYSLYIREPPVWVKVVTLFI